MTILDELRQLSSAEEFFAVLGVEFDPAVLRVARLHILRRMGEYLHAEALASLSPEAAREACRTQLQRAYDDFVQSSPLDQRVFKVLKDAAKPKAAPSKPFVPLSALTGSES
ncbi:MAG: nitrogenase stabilizing/protective protein NifW [Pseudomonadota bacterium]|jgi:nitrogenase-stabilizing/protective protein